MGLTFTWLFNKCFFFVGKVLGLISYLASSPYDVISPLLRKFFSNTVTTSIEFMNLFNGQTNSVIFASALPDVFNSILNLVNQVIWWLLDLVATIFRLQGEPFVFTVAAICALFFIPFFGFRFIRMILG